MVDYHAFWNRPVNLLVCPPVRQRRTFVDAIMEADVAKWSSRSSPQPVRFRLLNLRPEPLLGGYCRHRLRLARL